MPKQTAQRANLSPPLRVVLSGRILCQPASGWKISTCAPVHVKGRPLALFGGSLTPRQREVLQLVAEGKAGKEESPGFWESPHVREFHKAGIKLETLGMRTTAELTRYALQSRDRLQLNDGSRQPAVPCIL